MPRAFEGEPSGKLRSVAVNVPFTNGLGQYYVTFQRMGPGRGQLEIVVYAFAKPHWTLPAGTVQYGISVHLCLRLTVVRQ
jgi:hypothetical protein